MKTKAVTVLLAVLLAAQILTGCSETPVNSEPDTPEGAELSSQTPEESAAEEAPEEDSRLSLPDNLPEADFGGKEFRTVYPAYYDTALKGRYSSDPTTAEMVDLIMDGRAFDFGAQFYVSYYYKVRDLINEQNSDAASHFAETQKQQRLNAITFFNKCYGTDIAR